MNGRRVAPRLAALGTALLFCVLHSAELGAQCAMCSTAVGSSAGVARGFAVSIIFLLSTLSAVVGGFIALVLSQARSRPTGFRGTMGSGTVDAAGQGGRPAPRHSASSS